jgi:hypothetical protein
VRDFGGSRLLCKFCELGWEPAILTVNRVGGKKGKGDKSVVK